MNGYDAFQIYNSVRLHFTTDKFDYYRYNGKSKVSLESFEQRKDKYLFHKIARMFTEEELPFFYAVNFLKNDKIWVNSLVQDEASKTFKDWIKWQQARTHNFKEDLAKLSELNFSELVVCKDNQFPELLNLVFQNELHYDTLVILDHFIQLVDAWNNKLCDDFIWEAFYKKFKKYKPFFLQYAALSAPHYKKLLVENLTSKDK